MTFCHKCGMEPKTIDIKGKDLCSSCIEEIIDSWEEKLIEIDDNLPEKYHNHSGVCSRLIKKLLGKMSRLKT